MSREGLVQSAAFVVRCSGAAVVAHETATWFGLPQPLWATMSAVIVCQERLRDTQSSLTGRILGAVVGIVVAVTVSALSSGVSASAVEQMAVAVAVCALIAHYDPNLRVAMWTCPLILLSAKPSTPILTVALNRGSEVVFGAFVGWAFHWAAEGVVKRLTTLPAPGERNLAP